MYVRRGTGRQGDTMKLTFKIDLSDLNRAQTTLQEVQDLITFYRKKKRSYAREAARSAAGQKVSQLRHRAVKNEDCGFELLENPNPQPVDDANRPTPELKTVPVGESAQQLFDELQRLIESKGEATLEEVMNNCGWNSVRSVRAYMLNGMRSLKKSGQKAPFATRWDKERRRVVYTALSE